MRTIYYSLIGLLLLMVSCKPETESIFEETPEARAEQAKQALKDDLVQPQSGWRMLYQPEDESGSYWVLMHFFDDNRLVIESDLGVRDGEFFMDTLTYRIDNSLGVELIFETYSFFSYLFERDQATFLAEYEFNYVNKTPDGSLVFQSKTDPAPKSTLVFEPANADDDNLLAKDLSTNLTTLSNDIEGLLFSAPTYELSYQNKDLAFYVTLDDVRRTINFNSSSRKTTDTSQPVNFSTGYFLQGDSLIFHETFSGTYQGISVSFKSILFAKLSTTTAPICGGQEVHQYEGVTSQNDAVLLQATLKSPSGATFTDFNFLVSPLEYIYDNGENASNAISEDITGAGAMQLYYNYPLGGGQRFYAMGFFIQNADGTTTFALREFTPTLDGNKIVFEFADEISVFGNPDTPANIDNVNIYLDAFTQGDETYMFEVEDGVYEMNNPCTGWTAAFIGIE